MKKIRKIGLLVLVMLFIFHINAMAAGILQGDVNGDGTLNGADAIYLLRHTIMSSNYPVNQDVDMNGDGLESGADAIYLLRHTIMPSGYPLKNGDPNCDHQEMIDPEVAPSCEEAGLTEGKHCGKCNFILVKQEPVAALGHQYEDGVCTVCGNSIKPSENLLYTLSADGTYYIVSGIGECTDTHLIIPAEHEGLPVKEIGAQAFYNLKTLISIEIPEGVTTVGADAFAYNDKLISVSLPNTVTVLSDGLFVGCKSLISFRIPDGITKIPDRFFVGCKSLISVEIPNGVEEIGYSAFSSSGLTQISLPETLKTIGIQAFSDCEELEKIHIPNTVQTIGNYAFSGCASLTYIELPDTLTTIGMGMLHGCRSLKSIVLPQTLQTIGTSAFSGCSALETITFGGTESDWYYMEKNYGWDTDIPAYEVICLGQPSEAHDLAYTLSADGSYYIVTGIGECQSRDIIIPAEHEGLAVLEIGERAFSLCGDLASVQIAEGILRIGKEAFLNCERLLSVQIPDSVETLGEGAFKYCRELTSVSLGNGLTQIEKDTFYECTALTEISFPIRLVSIGDTAFYNCVDLDPIFPEMLRHIGAYAFKNCDLSQLALPLGLQGIGEFAFAGCRFAEIQIPDSVTSLGGGAFSGCLSLYAATLPSGLTEIPYNLFYDCRSLSFLNIPSGVAAINHNAFYHCDALTEIVIPKSVKTLGAGAFSFIENITIVYEGSEFAWTAIEKDARWAFSTNFTLEFMEENGSVKDVYDTDSYHSTYAYDYLGTLPKGEAYQTFYDRLAATAEDFHNNGTRVYIDADGYLNPGVPYADLSLTLDEAIAVWTAFGMDCPIYYWNSHEGGYTANLLYLKVDAEYRDLEIKKYCDEQIYSKIAQWVSMTSGETTAYDIALAYHDLILREIDYAYETDGFTPQDDAWAHNIVGVLAGKGEAVCESYAKTFQLLLNYSDVENVYVTSTAVNHAWNMVKLDDGNWYWCDLTWDDDPSYAWGIAYDFFCVNSTQNILWYFQDGGAFPDFDGDGILDYETFTEEHITDPVSMNGVNFMYPLPTVSPVVYDGTLRDTFEADGLRYAVSGYRTVQLIAIMKMGYVQIPETVTYNGVVYTVTSIGAMDSRGIYLSSPIQCFADSVYIPKTVKYIWTNAFRLQMPITLTVDSENPYYYSVGGEIWQRTVYAVRQSAKSAPIPKKYQKNTWQPAA